MAELRFLTELSTLLASFVPVHQASLELFKVISDSKARNYYQALEYVVYGNIGAIPGGRLLTAVFSRKAVVPPRLAVANKGWEEGKQARLVESFLLRSIGDNPVGEIGPADIENVVAIARDAAPGACRLVIERLDILLFRGTSDREEVVTALREVLTHEEGEVDAGAEAKAAAARASVERWIAVLEAEDRTPVGVLLDAWRREFVTDLLDGELRARLELGNSMRAAEFRYHRTLAKASTILAAIESVAVLALAFPPDAKVGHLIVAGLLSFGTLLLVPKATNSILEAIVGIGSRFAR